MEKNPCDTNQLDCDSHLPPRKRLLAGFKKLNNGSSSSSTSNGSSSSSSASTDVQTHLNNFLSSSSSRFNHNQSPEMLVEATRSAAVLAVKAAKTARAIANEKALVSAKAIAAAKRALELVDSFPKESMSPKKNNNNKQKKHVPVEFLYSKDQEEDLARRLHRGVDRRAEENCERNKKKHKKNKSILIGSMNDNDGNMDSDSSYDRLELNRKANKPDKAEGEESNTLCKRRGRVKLKKIPLSNCNSRDQENRISSASPLQTVAQLPEEEDGVVTVMHGPSSSQKCQDIKAQECVKQNKAVRSS